MKTIVRRLRELPSGLLPVLVAAAVLAALTVWTPGADADSSRDHPHGEERIDQVFASIADSTAWPLPLSPRNDLSSTFGPRIRLSTGTYDFHRGIDIHARTGDAVVAAYDSTLYGVRTFPDGGLTVILDHSFPEPTAFHGQEVTGFHTYYMHLDSVHPDLVEAAERGEHPEVPAGNTIGFAGASGAALNPHLHFEVRVGTRCSLELQLNEADRGCITTSDDPHVHPLILFPYPAAPPTVMQTKELGPDQDARFVISSPDTSPLVNRYEFVTLDQTGQVLDEIVLDLSMRVGFDSTSTKGLDTPDVSTMYLVPYSFKTSSPVWSTQVVIPASAVGSKAAGTTYRLTVTDVQGQTTAVDFGGLAQSW